MLAVVTIPTEEERRRALDAGLEAISRAGAP